jgi:hypothetical protein
MRIRNALRGSLGVAGVVGLLCAGVPNAQATDASLGSGAQERPTGSVQPRSNPDCTNRYSFDSTRVKADRIGRVGPPKANYFATRGTMKLSAGYNGSVEWSASTTISTAANIAIFGKISASIDAGVRKSTEVSQTNEVSFRVPAKHYGNGIYGRYRIVVTGMLHHIRNMSCRTSTKRLTYYVSGKNKPEGWCTWISTSPLGNRPVQCRDGSPYVP